MLRNLHVLLAIGLVYGSHSYGMEGGSEPYEPSFGLSSKAYLIAGLAQATNVDLEEELLPGQKILLAKVRHLLSRFKQMDFDDAAKREINSNEGLLEVILAVAHKYGKQHILLKGLMLNALTESNDIAIQFFINLDINLSLFLGDAQKEVVGYVTKQRDQLKFLSELKTSLRSLVEDVNTKKEVVFQRRIKDEEIALFKAVIEGSLEKVAHLVKTVVSINAKEDDTGNTALIYSVMYRSQKIVELLLLCGADILATNKRGDNAVQVAERMGDQKIARLLRFYRDYRSISSISSIYFPLKKVALLPLP